MKFPVGRGRVVAAVIVVAAAGGIVAIAHGGVSNTVVSAALRSQGLKLAGGSTHLGLGGATGEHVVVQTSRGEPLLDIRKLDVRYDLGSLAAGRPHAFGLEAITLDHPVLTLLRRADGSWNLPSGGANAPSSNSGPPVLPAHLAARLTVTEGTVVVEEPTAHDKAARVLRAEHINVSADADADAFSTYHATLNMLGAPVVGDGTIDAPHGTALHHWRAHDLPLGPALNAGIDSDAFVVHGGSLKTLDVTGYGFGTPGTPVLGSHFGGTAFVQDFAASVAGLAVPAVGLTGPLDLSDDGLTTTGIRGSIAGVPATLRGGLFSLSAPRLRLDTHVVGDMRALRTLFGFSRDLPLSGSVDAHVAVEGPVTSPLVFARLASGNVSYQDIPLTLAGATVAYHDGDVALTPVDVRYGPITAHAAGNIGVGDHVQPDIVVTASAPSAQLPYLQSFVSSGTTVATVVLGGRDAALDGRFFAASQGAPVVLSALGHINGRGEGIIAPVVLEADGRSRVLAGVALARPKQTLIGVAALDGVSFGATSAGLPGLSLQALPLVAATLDGTLAVGGDYHRALLAGDLAARDVTFNHRAVVDRARVVFDGDSRLLAVRSLEADGPLGSARAHGVAGTRGAALDGELVADLGVAGRVFDQPALRGTLRLPFDAVADGMTSGVRISDGRGDGASIAGVGLSSLDGTVVAGPHGVAVAAQAGLGSGRVLAIGDLGHGIGVSVSGVHALGQVVDAAALVDTQGRGPSAHGTVLIGNARIANVAAAASTAFAVDSSGAEFHDGIVNSLGMVAHVDGSVDGFSPQGKLAVRGSVHNGDIAPALAQFAPSSSSLAPAASLDAALQVGGTIASPNVTGSVTLPEGSVSGLAFSDAGARLEATRTSVRVRHGRVSVGSTTLHVGGAYDGSTMRSYVVAPQTNLADFNDAFDTPDTLAGRGSLRVTAASSPAALRTIADVDLSGVRYGTFDVGRTTAHWRTRGRNIDGKVDIDGAVGKLALGGGVDLATGHTQLQRLTRSRLALHGTASNLDLGHLLPLLGIDLPVKGQLDLAGTASGVAPAITTDLRADLHGGSVDTIPIEQGTLHVVARQGKAMIEQGLLTIPGAEATLTGSLGFAPKDPIALALHAQTRNIGTLASLLAVDVDLQGLQRDSKAAADTHRLEQAVKRLSPLDGSFGVSVDVSGSAASPKLAGAIDLEAAHVKGLPVPRGIASFTLAGRQFELSDAELLLPSGDLTFAGRLPIEISPLSIGPAHAPISFDLNADAINLASFAPLFPPDTKVGGILDGSIDLEGTPAVPQLFGSVQLANGSFVSSVETIPVTKLNAQLSVSGTSAALQSTARVDGGSVGVSGKASVASLTDLGADTAYSLTATANHAMLDLPAYGHGTLDAAVTLAHAGSAPPHVSGKATLTDAQIPLSVLANAPASSGPVSDSLFNRTTLDLHFDAPRNVRVRSGAIDLGATGGVVVGGTIGSPTVGGSFAAGGGTLTYFNRSFHVESGHVTFDPADGIDPQITATATTTVSDPDPNSIRNSSGRAVISLNVTGDPNNLKVDLSSQPSYGREQILGLLLNAPALGAVNFGGSGSGSTPGQAGSGGVTNPFAPPTTAQTNAAGISVSQTASSLVNAQFTQSLLAPLSSALGGAVGLSDLAVDLDQNGSFDFSARRKVLGNLYAVFSDSLGVPARQSLGLDLQPNDATDVAVSVFQETGASTLGRSPTATLFAPQSSKPVSAAANSAGAVTSGVSFSLNRRFP